MSSFVSARQSCQANSCSSSSFAVVGIHHRVCIDNIQQGIIQLFIEQKGSMMTWVPDFSQQIPIRQLFWWDLWPTESKGGDKAIITNCLLRSIATVSDDYHVLYERKIPTYVLVGIPTLCQISTYDSRTMSAFFVDGPDHLLGINIDL